MCDNYGLQHDTKYNPQKSMSMCMVIKPKHFKLHVPSIYGRPLACVGTTKYLGVLLSDDLHDGKDMARHLRSMHVLT